MRKLFGTDGIRGKANVFPMSPENVLKLGQAIGVYFRQPGHSPRILVGKDTRRSGYMLEQALGAGLCSVGVDVFQLGPLPTPGIAYLTRGLRATAGIVISASHNPYQDNGIKIFGSDGFKLPDVDESKLEEIMQEDLKSYLRLGMDIGRAKRIEDAIGQYAVFLKEQFPKRLRLDNLRIVLDCANGAAYKVAPKVFQELGAEVFCIGVSPNGMNINDMYGALHPQKLQEHVLLYKADIGFAYDGDADRLIVVDSEGELVDGDEILAIAAIFLKEKQELKHDTVVATVMSNLGLEIALGNYGIKLIRSQVGDRYVVQEMQSGDYSLGGEQSGHLVFLNDTTTGDAILASLNILRVMVEKNQSVRELKTVMKKLPQILVNIRIQNKVPLEKLPRFSKLLGEYEQQLNRKGRIIFRYSGTENLARIMIEGENEAVIQNYGSQLEDCLLAELKESLV